MKNLFLKILAVSFVIFGYGCTPLHENHRVTIAISKAVPDSNYINYFKWLRFGDSTVIYKDMYHLSYDSALLVLKNCDGLLLTGGTDVYPGRFGKEKDTSRCWEPDFKRDSLEFLLMHEALRSEMPIMGICRGLQVMNVYFGGSLIIDIPDRLRHTGKTSDGRLHQMFP